MTTVEIARSLKICQSAVSRSSLRGEKIAEENQFRLLIASPFPYFAPSITSVPVFTFIGAYSEGISCKNSPTELGTRL